MHRIVLHVDFDYFYAQCEEVRNPALRGVPVVVCVFSDRGEDTGAVATANYVAREYGVKSGMPIRFARNRLAGASPDAVFLPVDFGHYSEVSEQAMQIMAGTPTCLNTWAWTRRIWMSPKKRGGSGRRRPPGAADQGPDQGKAQAYLFGRDRTEQACRQESPRISKSRTG